MSEHVERVRVTNANPFMISDRHDGILYEFPPHSTTVIPTDAAQHIFGYPGDTQDTRLYMARRFGWNRPEHYKADDNGVLPWERMTAAIKLTVEHYEMRRVLEPGAPIPAEDAGEAPEMMSINSDPPAPRRAIFGRRRTKAAKRKARPRQLATASGPLTTPAPDPVLNETRDE